MLHSPRFLEPAANSNPVPDKSSPNKELSTTLQHATGWEVLDSWQSQCTYGANGCEKQTPGLSSDHYWSLLEFGIVLRRHAPYFFATVTLPLLAAITVSLFAFWIENLSHASLLSVFAVLLQSFIGWTLLKQLPPGNGQIPRILLFYGLSFIWNSCVAFAHITLSFVLDTVPGDVELPFRLTNFSDQLRRWRAFNVEGFSFDPQSFLLGGSIDGSLSRRSTLTAEADVQNPTSLENALFEMDAMERPNGQALLDSISATTPSNTSSYIDIPEEVGDDVVADAPESTTKKSARSHLEEELHTLRRGLFFVFAAVIVLFMLFLL